MRQAEGIDDTIRSVVATAGIPAEEVCIGAELYHRIRTGSSGEGMPMLSRTDEGIDKGQKSLIHCPPRRTWGAGGGEG